MSTAECTSRSETGTFRFLWRQALRHRSTMAWLASAAIVTFAAVVCATIQVRDSIFDVTQLQLLVGALLNIAATNVLLASRIRRAKWHVGTWATVTTGFLLCLLLT